MKSNLQRHLVGFIFFLFKRAFYMSVNLSKDFNTYVVADTSRA